MNIVISGASSGIGQYLARRLHGQGHSIWGLARSELTRTEEFHSLSCNVAEWEQVRHAAEVIRAAPGWGYVNALIHCAAQQSPIGPTVKIDPAAWATAIRINLDGTFYMVRAFHAALARRDGVHAKVLCFSGGGATKARPNFSAYAASKTAVVRLVENLAAEWEGSPIDINAIAPGAVNTRMIDEILRTEVAVAGQTEVEAARRIQSQGEEGFERVGRLVDFLLSGESNGLTGKLISAQWDPWEKFGSAKARLQKNDLLTLRRIVPPERGEPW